MEPSNEKSIFESVNSWSGKYSCVLEIMCVYMVGSIASWITTG